jgi:hypothetical protein
MNTSKKGARSKEAAQPAYDPRAAVRAVAKLSTVPTSEEIARAFNALKKALEI